MSNKIGGLPPSEELNISALSRLFQETTNSYKYLFFLSILDILNRQNFEPTSPIEFSKIIIEMLANAWYPHTYFKLFFGWQDKITQKLDSLNLDINQSILQFKDPDKKCLRETIASQNLDDVITFFRRYVPFRLLTPFFKQELKGIDTKYEVDKQIPSVSINNFETCKPLYCFDTPIYRDCKAIILHPKWAAYIQVHYWILRAWVSWEWLKYMQKRNPSVPALANKLFPPQKRESLSKQTKYWELVLRYTDVLCIYSERVLNKTKFSLDHYLPWSFVAHDQLWNLIPTFPEINSSKSNNLPANIYFDKFVRVQHHALSISHEKMPESKWTDCVESYLSDLKIPNKDDLLELDKLTQAYCSTVFPLVSIAARQGFNEWAIR